MYDLIVIYSERYKDHKMDTLHPECPERLNSILEGVENLKSESSLIIKIDEPELVEEDEILRVHVPDLVYQIKRVSELGGGRVSLNTSMNEHSYTTAKLAVGGTIKATRVVVDGISKTSFALIRPPGHHAEVNSCGGFCFFNNIAIAAEWLISERNIKKIAILDIDQHFGNGTAHIFYHRKDVLYLSLHAHPQYSYPGSGYPSEVGIDEGEGFTVNIPLLPNTENVDWLYALKTALQIVEQYKPEIILVSVGFDALKGDPTGILNITSDAYQAAGYMIHEIAEKLTSGKIVSVLEGGYYLKQLATVTNKYLNGILGEKSFLCDDVQIENITEHTIDMINLVKKAQKDYWVL